MSDREIQLDANEERAARQRRLRYRSWKRGTKEMDLLMGNFADTHITTMSDAELDQFEAMLLESDPDLYSWYMGNSKPPADNLNPMIPRFLAFDYTPEER
jgi:antitoxin CptB